MGLLYAKLDAKTDAKTGVRLFNKCTFYFLYRLSAHDIPIGQQELCLVLQPSKSFQNHVVTALCEAFSSPSSQINLKAEKKNTRRCILTLDNRSIL